MENGILATQETEVIEIENGLPVEGSLDIVHCETAWQIPNGGINVQKGDQFAVFIYNGCQENFRGNVFCPVQLNLINNNSCQGSLFQSSDRIPTNIDITNDQLVTAVQIEANIKISISKSPYQLDYYH